MKEKYEGQEDEEEHVISYRMTFRKGESTGNWQRRFRDAGDGWSRSVGPTVSKNRYCIEPPKKEISYIK
jgi:hypothetical protein